MIISERFCKITTHLDNNCIILRQNKTIAETNSLPFRYTGLVQVNTGPAYRCKTIAKMIRLK